MMDKRPIIQQRDLEKLSEYIDGQLDDRQTHRLEARLQQEPELRRELESLRMTVRNLRELPTPRPARHFTLTPEMVGQRPTRRAYPVLRFATALAGLAFVALVGLEGLQSVSGSQLAARAPEMMQEAQLAEDAFSSDKESLAAEPAEERAAAPEAMEMPAEEAAEEEPQALRMEAPEAEQATGTGEDQAQESIGTPDPTEAAAMAAGESAENVPELDAQAEEAGEPLALEDGAVEEVRPEALNAADAESQQQTAPAQVTALRWLQVLAGVLFILLSVLTITYRPRPS